MSNILFKPSSKIYYWPFQGGISFVDILWVFSVLCLLCLLCVSVYMCLVVTCWERADNFALVVVFNCECVTFSLVSWVRCGTWFYWVLIFAPLLTLNFLNSILCHTYCPKIVLKWPIHKNYLFTRSLIFLAKEPLGLLKLVLRRNGYVFGQWYLVFER